MFHSQSNRHEQNSYQWQRARRRFEHATNDQSPGAAREVLQAKQREAAERDSGPEDETNKICMKELIAVDEETEEQQHEEHGANYQRHVPTSREFNRW